MKYKQIVAAAAFAVAGAQAFAATPAEAYQVDTGTYFFGATGLQASDSGFTFTFTLDASDGLAAGTYDIVGDLSGTYYGFTSATLNGQAWDLYANGRGRVIFGDIEVEAMSPITITVAGNYFGPGAANFQGSIVLTPVPEPETYALMLGGLAAVGFVIGRRRQG